MRGDIGWRIGTSPSLEHTLLKLKTASEASSVARYATLPIVSSISEQDGSEPSNFLKNPAVGELLRTSSPH